MYSKLVKKYSDELYDLTRQYENGTLDDENYYNEISLLLKEFQIEVKKDLLRRL